METAFKFMKRGKAGGEVDFNIDMIKDASVFIIGKLADLFTKCGIVPKI